MGIIEQAVLRLEQLRRSGIAVNSPGDASVSSAMRAAERLGSPFPTDHDDVPSRARALRPAAASPFAARAGSPTRSRHVNVDLARLSSLGYLTPDQPQSRLANEFRVIKRPLLNNVRGKGTENVEPANLIMVTSSLPGEGKTFVSLNLAISLAMELDTMVLLVDADVARPSLLGRMALPPARGLLDLLTNPSIGLSEVLLRTNIDHLSLLPSGKPDPKATEILASEGMSQLLGELASRYSDRIIVFDAPPLLPSPESRVLATHMGQVVLVVEAGCTLQSQLEQSVATLADCPVVLPLLNKMSQSDVGSYYGHYGV